MRSSISSSDMWQPKHPVSETLASLGFSTVVIEGNHVFYFDRMDVQSSRDGLNCFVTDIAGPALHSLNDIEQP